MGRFKIYDSKKLVNVVNDNYAKCLLCERTLKNIMGNIKRHYEQMHSVSVNANTNKSRKSRKGRNKSGKLELGNNKAYNRTTETALNEKASNLLMNEINENGETVTNSTVASSFNSASKKPKLSKLLCQKNVAASPIINATQIKNVAVSNAEIKHHIPSQSSHLKQVKLKDEPDAIQIPCNSYVNSIKISSVDSCRQVEFLTCLVETTSEMNIPLINFKKGDTFQKALQTWSQNFQFNYSSQKIGEQIDRMAKKIRQEIIKMVENRIIYLKLDIANSKNGNLMLVNIQFIDDFEMKIITLSALELLDDDLVTNLKKKVLSTLECFRINMSRVYTITKDNTKHIRKSLKRNENEEKYFAHGEANDTTAYSYTNEYCQHLCEQFPGHIIHFAACDIIKQLSANISQSRNAVRTLRKQLSEINVKQVPLLDNAKSWLSVYDMIESLLNVREIVQSNNTLSVEVDWLFVTKFIASFGPVVAAVAMLQTNCLLVMGDFYREWLLCEIELQELTASNELALYLVEALRKRKLHLFKNTSFLAALYMDPRFCYMGSMCLNDKQKEMAITHLLKIFNKLKEVSSAITNDVNHNDRYSKLETQTAAAFKNNSAKLATFDTLSLINGDYHLIRESLEQLQFEGRLSVSANILEYWKMAKYKYPILWKIAEIALAAPATQATISRALIVSPIIEMKDKLNEPAYIIENLALLKLNQDLVDKIALEK